MDTGDLTGAASDYNAMAAISTNLRTNLARAYITGTPGHSHYDPASSCSSARKLQEAAGSAESFWIEARTLYLAGRYSEAISAIDRGGMDEDFWCLFWKGMAYLKREDYSMARVLLIEARRRNPYFLKIAARFPDTMAFATQVDREVAREAGKASGTAAGRGSLALRRLTIPEIEAAAMAVRFRRALTEYKKLGTEEFSKSTADHINRRVIELAGAADALDKLVSSINKGTRKIEVNAGSNKLKVIAADDEGFEFAITKGSGRFPWSSLDPWELYCLANEERLTGPERCGLAAFLWDAGEIRRSSGELDRAAVLSPEMRAAFNESIALRKGVPVPDGGFVYFKGDWITPEEKANLQKGLVPFEGGWVTAEDREKLKRGFLKSGDKWVARADKELLDRGWRKENGAWLSPEDYISLHQDWQHAWEATTDHFQIRTNVSESLCDSLKGMLEAALPVMRAYHNGGEVRPAAGKKIQVFAFRTFADYRMHCEKSGSQDRLNAAGFARSDSDTIVGWNKTGDEADVCATIAHELEHYVSFRLHPALKEPSWFAEGTATYFEGVRRRDGGWTFHELVEARLQFLQTALAGGKTLDLEHLLKQDAGDLIRTDPSQAITYYCSCWALVYYLENCGDSKTRKAFEDFKKSLWNGGRVDLKVFFPDLKSLESAVTKFVLGL